MNTTPRRWERLFTWITRIVAAALAFYAAANRLNGRQYIVAGVAGVLILLVSALVIHLISKHTGGSAPR